MKRKRSYCVTVALRESRRLSGKTYFSFYSRWESMNHQKGIAQPAIIAASASETQENGNNGT